MLSGTKKVVLVALHSIHSMDEVLHIAVLAEVKVFTLDIRQACAIYIVSISNITMLAKYRTLQ